MPDHNEHNSGGWDVYKRVVLGDIARISKGLDDLSGQVNKQNADAGGIQQRLNQLNEATNRVKQDVIDLDAAVKLAIKEAVDRVREDFKLTKAFVTGLVCLVLTAVGMAVLAAVLHVGGGSLLR